MRLAKGVTFSRWKFCPIRCSRIIGSESWVDVGISDEEYEKIALEKDERLGDWNYIIHPLAYKK